MSKMGLWKRMFVSDKKKKWVISVDPGASSSFFNSPYLQQDAAGKNLSQSPESRTPSSHSSGYPHQTSSNHTHVAISAVLVPDESPVVGCGASRSLLSKASD